MENRNNKVIVITGASSGIGAATARKLSGLGVKLVLAARREDQLRSLSAQLGDNVFFVKTDVSSKPDADHLAKWLLRRRLQAAYEAILQRLSIAQIC